MWKLAFWKGAGERAIKTFFQTFVAVVGVTGIGVSVGVGQVDWLTAASVAAVATVLSIATSIGNADFTAGAPQPGAHAASVTNNYSTPGGGAPLIGA